MHLIYSAVSVLVFLVVAVVVGFKLFYKKPKPAFFEEDINAAAQRKWEEQRQTTRHADQRD